MLHPGNASHEELQAYQTIVLAYIAEHGPLVRSEIWHGLHERLSVGYVDRSLKTLLAEGRIQVAKAEFAKPVDYPWTKQKALRYTASVYAVVDHDG